MQHQYINFISSSNADHHIGQVQWTRRREQCKLLCVAILQNAVLSNENANNYHVNLFTYKVQK